MATLDFVVTGMVCDGCSGTVEKAVSGLSGVSSVSANHNSGATSVQHDDSVSAQSVYEAINGAGFGVQTCGNEDCTCPNCHCNPCSCTKEKACGCS